MLGVAHSAIALFDEARREGYVEGEFPPDFGAVGTRIRLTEPMQRRLIDQLENIQAYDLNDGSHDVEFGAALTTLRKLGIRSILIVPIVSGGHAVGSLSLDITGEPRRFSEQEVKVTMTFAAQIAAAIEHDSWNARMTDLRDQALALGGIQNPETMLDVVVHSAVSLLKAKGGGMYLWLPDEAGLELVVEPYRPHLKGIRLKVGEGIAGKLVDSGNREPITHEDYSKCVDAAAVFRDPCPFGSVIEMLLKMPDGRLFGVLYLDDDVGRVFTMADARLLQLFTDHALAAIQSGEAARGTLASQRRWELVQDAAGALISAPSLREGCQNMARFLSDSLALSFCRILAVRDSDSIVELLGLAMPPDTVPSKQRYLEGINGTAWMVPSRLGSTQKTAEALDARETRNLYSHPTLTALNSAVLVGFRMEGNLSGILELGLAYASPFQAAERRALGEALADRIGPLFSKLWGQDQDHRYREKLLHFVARSNQLKPGNGLARLEPDFTGMTRELGGASAAALYAYREAAEELVFLHGDGAVPGVNCTNRGASASRAARSGSMDSGRPADGDQGVAPDWAVHVVSVPLRVEGRVTHVVSLWYPMEKGLPGPQDLKLLDYFAQSGAMTLYIAELLGRNDSLVGKASSWKMVSEISGFLLETKSEERALDAILTGVTADWGLRFNRAAILLLNERADKLLGAAGVGDIERSLTEESWRRWANSTKTTVPGYLAWIAANVPKECPIGRAVRPLSLDVSMRDTTPFADILFHSLRKVRLIDQPLESGMHDEFLAAFQPTSPVHLVRIQDGSRPIGILAADRRFTQGSISPDEEGFLIILANLAGRTLAHIRSEHAAPSLIDAGPLYAAPTPEDTLRLAANQLCLNDPGAGVSILLMEGGAQTRIEAAGCDRRLDYGAWQDDELSAQVLQSGLPHVVKTADDLPSGIRAFAEQAGYRSSLALPLIEGEEPVGVAWIHHTEPGRFDDHRVAQMRTYLYHTVSAYTGKLRWRLESSLATMTEQLSGNVTAKEVLDRIAVEARKVFGADMSTVWPYHESSDSFKHDEVAGDGWPQDCVLSPPQFGRTTYQILQKDNYVEVSDARKFEAELPPSEDRARLSDLKIKSFLGVALKIDNDRLGVLYVSYRTARTFSPRNKPDLLRFAALAAVALKRARWMDQARRLKQAMQVVAEVTVSGGLTTTLTVIAERIQEALSCACVVLYSYNPERREFEYPPGISSGVRNPDAVREADGLPSASFVRKFLERRDLYPVPRTWDDANFKTGRRFTREEEIESCVIVPLSLPDADVRVGVMFVNYRQARSAFGEAELEDIQFFGKQAAVACRHAQILNDSRLLSQQQTLLAALSGKLLNVSLGEALQSAVEVAAAQLQVPFACVVLPRADKLIFMRGAGWPKDYDESFELEPGVKSHAGFTILEKLPVQVDDFSRENRFAVPERIAQNRIRSGLSVPIQFGATAIGAMLVHSQRLRHFTPSEVIFLSAVASQLGIGIHHHQA